MMASTSPIINRHLLPFISRRIRTRQFANLQQTLETSQCSPSDNSNANDSDNNSSSSSSSSSSTNKGHYGTQMDVIHTPPTQSSPLKPYLQTSLSTQPTLQNMEFGISFLGTSSGSSTMHRNGSCTALRLGGQTFLFDCAEGTVRQLLHSRINVGSVTKILISHLHGDHVYGLVPLILEMQVGHKLTQGAVKENKKTSSTKSRQREDMRLEIYGPPGIYNYIAMTLALSCSKLNYLKVDVTELVGGKEERGIRPGSDMSRRRKNVFLGHYPEVEVGTLKRKYLEMNKQSRTWTISSPKSINAEIIESNPNRQQNGFTALPNDVNSNTREVHITAAELDHLKGVQTFGYTIEEQTPPGNIDADKAKSLGVAPSKKYSLLKCGIPVPSDDGSSIVHPKDVLTQTFRARKLTFLADHRLVPPPMQKLCRNSDVLIHEATLSIKDGIDKIKIRGHNTAYHAGLRGKTSHSHVVVLNHFGGVSASNGGENVEQIVEEAREGNGGMSEIVASYDFMELVVPRGGFWFNRDAVEIAENERENKGSGEVELLASLPSMGRWVKHCGHDDKSVQDVEKS